MTTAAKSEKYTKSSGSTEWTAPICVEIPVETVTAANGGAGGDGALQAVS